MEHEINPQQYGITREMFLEWRSPRFGNKNPTRIESKVWQWLVHTKLNAYQANQTFNGPSPYREGPTWSFDRFGQSATELPDGRVIYIGGEHEDHYDPDFYIYNDVTVVQPDGSVVFYCYPKDVFPPTDFHTATLVDSKIVIIGSLGYPVERHIMTTQVYILDINDYVITKMDSSGNPPGWIHEHTATLSPDETYITVTQGQIDLGPDIFLRENIDDWKLNLSDWRWERLTHRKWVRWEIKRQDRQCNHLWEIRQASWALNVKWDDQYQEQMESLQAKLGHKPDVRLVENLYCFDVPHKTIPSHEDEYNVFRVSIDGVTVRFVEESHCVQATIEGELPANIVENMQKSMLSKISALENAACDLEVY